jgi:TetR/AcrR family transcriptional regulator
LSEADSLESGPGAAATRERILDAAEALFAENGLAGTAVRDIARDVGLTAASLYNHFAGKQELYEAVLERGVRPLIEMIQEMPSDSAAMDSRLELIDRIMHHLGSRPHLPRLVHHEVISGGSYLAKLGRTWLRPLIATGIGEMKRQTEPNWTEEEYPLVITAWLNLVFGHFAMAPMLSIVFDTDPLAPESIERQTQFLQKLARIMATADPGPSAQ